MKTPNGIEVQQRDLALLLGLFESRVMLHAQATRLYFAGRKEGAKKRLQALRLAGLISERPHRRYEPAVLFLTRRGFGALSDGADLAAYPKLEWAMLEKRLQVSDLSLRHELGVVEVKAAVVHALRQTTTHELIEFSTWPRLFAFGAERRVPGTGRARVLVKPDGFIRIAERSGDGEYTFFLEVDRSTQTQDRLAFKALCYSVARVCARPKASRA